ncbi:PREDICTED: selenium-binding protein 1-A-like [Nicrophorus vespilloides]|uniref:Selenium-binding protein 1-A-like n=1 Tax=Nicrophorus vespilloides TaxID=110193 RepID=A0ABM1MVC0_NICVS|nr:PREDICTED: selenium-binding protein 1-A-like [Nicrophorus vespilloides]
MEVDKCDNGNTEVESCYNEDIDEDNSDTENTEVDKCCGPGYATPMDAFLHGKREKLLYVICVQPNPEGYKSDILSTVDVNPKSKTYQQIIHTLPTGKINDEIHHSGWNTCSSCHGKKAHVRDKLILPCLGSDRVIIVETGKKPRSPSIHKIIDSSDMHKYNCASPHTSHCLANGDVMISTLGVNPFKSDFF